MADVVSNFAFLATLDPDAARVGAQAERLLHADPPACLVKLRLLGEYLAQHLAVVCGVQTYADDQHGRLRALRDHNVLDALHADQFHALRVAGNAAGHENKGDLATARKALRIAWQLGVFTRRTSDPSGTFKPPPFVEPASPDAADRAALAALAAAQQELDTLRAKQSHMLADVAGKGDTLAATQAKLDAALQQLEALGQDCKLWEDLATEAARKHQDALDALRRKIAATPGANETYRANAARAAAAYTPTEAEVRQGVDAALTRVGWTADSETLRWSLGVRPAVGVAQAIAEVPTGDGVADYVLFDGLDALAVVEAKAAHVDVPGALQQATRYARAFVPDEASRFVHTQWEGARVPFVFATNGRAFFPQLKDKSGIWMAALHRPAEAPRPLDGWYSPEGLRQALSLDPDDAHRALAVEPVRYPDLRAYQKDAIAAVESALARGQRRVLLAMATGTGKTRTCLGLMYRLLKARRFRRILFLVDRAALADQALEQFASERLEGAKSLTEIYDVKGLDARDVDADTRLHVSTVQGLIRRILFAERPEDVPPVDQYDCIVVDECHRGYALDAEMTDLEMRYRSEDDYLSKYRRALEHFDAVCIGLTATPALHTTQIFGRPVYQYRFRDAVLDGYLVDQEPVVRIRTRCGTDGIFLPAESEVLRWDPVRNDLSLDVQEDAVHFQVDDFNARVLVESFNRVVCEEIVRQIDPDTPGKTLVFCVNDAHADAVVRLLREALASLRGMTDPNLVAKITGKADQPRKLLRRFRLEQLPDIAVTVDLLTTGVDVPAITALVFLRAVQSRILYEQMLGRATRLCSDFDKTSFKVFDAVGVTEALRPVSTMMPVAVDPGFTFGQLLRELRDAADEAVRDDVLDQLHVRLRARAQRLDEAGQERFLREANESPSALLEALRSMDSESRAAWWQEHAGLAQWFDTRTPRPQGPIVVDADDEVIAVEQDLGGAPPGEYLDAFGAFVAEQLNLVPALQVVVQRPRDLTRATLKSVRTLLDAHGYSEPTLQAAWRQTRNADIAAGIVGHIRQRALGSPLVAYELRVDAALARVLASRDWNATQRRWLERIAHQMKTDGVVDRATLDTGAFANQGGARALDAAFDGDVDAVLGDLLDAAWNDSDPALQHHAHSR